MKDRIDGLIAALTLEEKAALMTGEDIMSTPAVDRLSIPKIRVTDGPSGARGDSLPGTPTPPSSCIPCGSALGATWDPAVTGALGELVGREALDRGCRGLLAPTVNLHRSPLAGRNFECYSEDPLLTGVLAAAYIRGVQARGVFATVKHFVANDAEFERGSIDSIVDERALRELYLVPFEMAVRDGRVLGVMSSYNRLNGRWLTEQPAMLTDLLRHEWGFDGLVMTDWFATLDTDVSPGAGLDLEMPGPGRGYGDALVTAVRAGRLAETDLDRAVRALLGVYDRIGALSEPTAPKRPQPQTSADVELLRHASARSMVLLRNDGVLPLRLDDIDGRRPVVAVIGPRAARPSIVGGGSAELTTYPVTSPLDALTALIGDRADVVYARGCTPDRRPDVVGTAVLVAEGPFTGGWHVGDSFTDAVAESVELDELRLMMISIDPASAQYRGRALRIEGTVTATETGRFRLALAQAGSARVVLDGEIVLDGFVDVPPPGGAEFFGMGSQDLIVEIDLVAGRRHDIAVEFVNSSGGIGGFRVGIAPGDEDALLAAAIEAAAAADVVVAFVGTSGEWETEGRDRTTLTLPGRQDELVRAVAERNPNTVVVVNAGAPVDLPWIESSAATMLSWLGGQETGHAVAEVLLGDREPAGRLPTTLPKKLGHSPSHANFPGENGTLRYGEGVFMGYRGFLHSEIEPLFPFGFGLGYSTFEFGAPVLDRDEFRRGDRLIVRVPVTNTGDRDGSTVVQCYVSPAPCRLGRPPLELRAFARLDLAAGQREVVELQLDDRAFSYWDPGQDDFDDLQRRVFAMFQQGNVERRAPGWQLDAGTYGVHIGHSVADIVASVDVRVVG